MVQSLQADLDESAIDVHDALGQVDQARSEARYLRSVLVDAGQAQSAYTDAPVSASEPPSSFEELLDRLPELQHIDFTGDRSTVLELDDLGAHKAVRWAAKAYRALQALNSYAEHSTAPGGFAGSFVDFCLRPPAGGDPYPANQVVPTESASVGKQWSAERCFPVPVTVDPSGTLYMDAHIRIDSKGSVCPRIYFHDDTAGTGVILVGMIGRHLTNTMT